MQHQSRQVGEDPRSDAQRVDSQGRPCRWGMMMVLLASALSAGAVGCGAVYPELTTQMRPKPAALKFQPPPPENLVFLRFHGAQIPRRTRDGRAWDEVGGSAPDPFAVLLVDGKEILRTPIQSNTLEPTWPDADKANYRVSPQSRARVELWDKNSVQNRPICVQELEHLEADLFGDVREIACETGAKVWLRMQPAHGLWGIGFWYELGDRQVGITRVLQESPAYRAGLRAGQRVLSIQGKEVATMTEGEPQSLVTANVGTGIRLVVLDSGGKPRTVEVHEGPIYPVFGEGIPIE